MFSFKKKKIQYQNHIDIIIFVIVFRFLDNHDLTNNPIQTITKDCSFESQRVQTRASQIQAKSGTKRDKSGTF